MGGKKYLALGLLIGMLCTPIIANANEYMQGEIFTKIEQIYSKQKSIDEYLQQILEEEKKQTEYLRCIEINNR